MTDEKNVIVPQSMCQMHQRLLLDQVGVGPDGPWRSHIIVAQIAMFQGTTAHPDTYDRIGRDITRIGELGCLACFRPDVFGQVVQAFQDGGFQAVRELGERLVNGAAKS